MKKLSKIMTVLMIVTMLLSVFSTVMAATSPDGITVTNTNQFDSLGGKIIGAVQAIGNIVSILMLIVIGIKYMVGSAEEKAEYKKTLMPYLIGAVLIFAASNIAKVVYNMATEI